jgi:signal transduction histidine kinase
MLTTNRITKCRSNSGLAFEERLQVSTKKDLLRIAQEAISNSVRHAKPANVKVSLQCGRTQLLLEIADDGSGIDDPQEACQEGFGLSNMRARAEKLGAQFEVRTAQGRGTNIVVRLALN